MGMAIGVELARDGWLSAHLARSTIMLRGVNVARPLLGAAIVVATLIGTASLGEAAPVTLSDQNTLVEIDPNSQAGQYTWRVDGTDNLFQRWFWYRIGNFGPEQSIDTIS